MFHQGAVSADGGDDGGEKRETHRQPSQRRELLRMPQPALQVVPFSDVACVNEPVNHALATSDETDHRLERQPFSVTMPRAKLKKWRLTLRPGIIEGRSHPARVVRVDELEQASTDAFLALIPGHALDRFRFSKCDNAVLGDNRHELEGMCDEHSMNLGESSGRDTFILTSEGR